MGAGKMTDDKFNLSEKGQTLEGLEMPFYSQEDVKEFIKIMLSEGWEMQIAGDNEDFKKGVQAMKEKIRRYAGKKLWTN
jgi:hypothetical protein